MEGQSWHYAIVTLVLRVQTHFSGFGLPYFYENFYIFKCRIESSFSWANIWFSVELLFGRKKSKTGVSQSQKLEFRIFPLKQVAVMTRHGYTICRVFHGLSDAENPIWFRPQIRKLWIFFWGRVCQNFKLP